MLQPAAETEHEAPKPHAIGVYTESTVHTLVLRGGRKSPAQGEQVQLLEVHRPPSDCAGDLRVRKAPVDDELEGRVPQLRKKEALSLTRD